MRKVVVWILAIILAGSSFLLFSGIHTADSSPGPERLEDIYHNDLKPGNLYLAEDLVIVDAYLPYAGGTCYLLVTWQDSLGYTVAGIMPVSQTSAIRSKAEDYYQQLFDYPSQKIVESESCYVEIGDPIEDAMNTQIAFQESISDLWDGNNVLYVAELSNAVNYHSSVDEDSAAKAITIGKVQIVDGIAALAASILLIYFGALRKPKASKSLSEEDLAAQNDAIAVQLDYYQSLLEEGFMTQEEYNKKRKELMKS